MSLLRSDVIKNEKTSTQTPSILLFRAFSTTEAVEAMHALKSGNLEALSAQQVMDCSYGFGSLYGCKGGDTCAALKWMNSVSKHACTVDFTDTHCPKKPLSTR